MQDQEQTVSGCSTFPGRLEMNGQNPPFLDPAVRQETIHRFGVRPILTGERNGLPHTVRQLSDKLPEAAAKSCVLKPAAGKLPVQCCGHSGLLRRGIAGADFPKHFCICLFPHSGFTFYRLSPTKSEDLWVIERLPKRLRSFRHARNLITRPDFSFSTPSPFSTVFRGSDSSHRILPFSAPFLKPETPCSVAARVYRFLIDSLISLQGLQS